MKKSMKVLFIILLLATLVFFAYFNNTCLVNPITVGYYKELKKILKQRGYKDRLLVISTKRFKFDNYIFMKISQAIPNSRHLKGEAIDFLVFDINSDGKANGKDVDIVSGILKNEIIKGNGSIGTYKKKNQLTRQMVHIDCFSFRNKLSVKK